MTQRLDTGALPTTEPKTEPPLVSDWALVEWLNKQLSGRQRKCLAIEGDKDGVIVLIDGLMDRRLTRGQTVRDALTVAYCQHR